VTNHSHIEIVSSWDRDSGHSHATYTVTLKSNKIFGSVSTSLTLSCKDYQQFVGRNIILGLSLSLSFSLTLRQEKVSWVWVTGAKCPVNDCVTLSMQLRQFFLIHTTKFSKFSSLAYTKLSTANYIQAPSLWASKAGTTKIHWYVCICIYVCMYVCTNAYIYIYTHTHIHTHKHTRAHTHPCACLLHECIYINTSVCIYMYIYTHTYMQTRACTHTLVFVSFKVKKAKIQLYLRIRVTLL
jgi:hypothetical protein